MPPRPFCLRPLAMQVSSDDLMRVAEKTRVSHAARCSANVGVQCVGLLVQRTFPLRKACYEFRLEPAEARIIIAKSAARFPSHFDRVHFMKMTTRPTETPTISQGTRSFISLWLVIHAFMIGVTFFSVYPPAAFQTRLLGVLSGYNQTLNFDLDLSPYFLTGDDLISTPEGFRDFSEREYFIEALPKGESADNSEAWIRVGDRSFRWTEHARRMQRLGFAAQAAGVEEWQAELVTGIARLAQAESGVEVNRIRVRQHVPVPQENYLSDQEFDPQDDVWFRTVYEVIVINGKILPVVDSRETAGALGQRPSGTGVTPATPVPATNSPATNPPAPTQGPALPPASNPAAATPAATTPAATTPENN